MRARVFGRFKALAGPSLWVSTRDSSGEIAGRAAARRHERMPIRVLATAWIGLILPATPSHGSSSLTPDGAALTAGYGDDVAVYGVALDWSLSRPFAEATGNALGLRLVGQAAYWRGDERSTGHGSLWDFGITPVLRWTPAAEHLLPFFVDGGVGLHVLTATRINDHRMFSTAFQFGEQIAMGFAFGPSGRYELGAYLQHVSNGRIKEPNCGLTYPGITLRVALP